MSMSKRRSEQEDGLSWGWDSGRGSSRGGWQRAVRVVKTSNRQTASEARPASNSSQPVSESVSE